LHRVGRGIDNKADQALHWQADDIRGTMEPATQPRSAGDQPSLTQALTMH